MSEAMERARGAAAGGALLEIRGLEAWYGESPVSYTHLTLPTN